MSLTLAICDDDVLNIELLEKHIDKILKDESIEYNLFKYFCKEELLNDYPENLDILFLDIKIKGISSIDIARKIREIDKNVEVMFITPADYIFKARAFRCLAKPLKYEEIRLQLRKSIKEYLEKHSIISIQSRKKTLVLPIRDILYAEVRRKEVTIYTEEKTYTIETSMKRLEGKVLDYSFYRCHHSYLVNLKKIQELREKSIIIRGFEIPISRSKNKELKIRLDNLSGACSF